MAVQLYEKHRPAKFQDVIGHWRVKQRLLALRENVGWDNQVFWFAGPSGVGKTTAARLIANTVSDEFATEEINAAKLSVDLLDNWERKCASKPLIGGAWCFVVNEAHMLSTRVVSELLTVLEEGHVQNNSTWLFTTTKIGQRRFDGKLDACPFLSRALCFEFTVDEDYLNEGAERLLSIAQSVNMDGQGIGAYVKLLTACEGNMRQAIQFIASGGMIE